MPRAYDHVKGELAKHLEPIVKDNSQFGIGGAPQMKTPRGLATTEIYDSVLGRNLSEPEIFSLIQKWQ